MYQRLCLSKLTKTDVYAIQPENLGSNYQHTAFLLEDLSGLYFLSSLKLHISDHTCQNQSLGSTL